MKKLIAMLMIAGAGMGLYSCGGSQETQETDTMEENTNGGMEMEDQMEDNDMGADTTMMDTTNMQN